MIDISILCSQSTNCFLIKLCELTSFKVLFQYLNLDCLEYAAMLLKTGFHRQRTKSELPIRPPPRELKQSVGSGLDSLDAIGLCKFILAGNLAFIA